MSSVGAAKVTPESRKLKEKDMRREEIAQDHVSIQKAERFILQVYYIVDKNIAMMSLLDYEPALEKFNEYIAFEASNCAFTMQFWHALRHLEHQRTDEAMFKLAKNLSNCFFCEPGDGNRVLVSNFAKQSVLNATKKDVLVVKEVLAAFRLTHTELIAFLANLYTKFLQSKYYTSWRCQERGHAAGLALQYVLKYSDIPVGGTPEKRNPKLPTGSIKRGLIPPLKTQLVELEKVTKSGKNNSLVVRPALKVQVENNISSTESANNKLPVSASPGGDQFPTDFPSYSNPNHSSGCSDSSNSGVSVGTGKISQQKDGETVTNRIRHMTSVVPDEENDHSWTLKSVYFLPKTEDLANTAFHSMDLGKLSKLIACESRWLIILLAGLENLPLSFSLHSATTATLTPAGGRKGITVQFPYIYANRFHEKMADVHRKLLKNKPMHALFDNFSEIEKLIKARLVTSLAENPKGTLAKTGSFIGLLGSKVNTLSADITPPTSLSKKFTSVKVNHSRFFKPKPLKFEPSTAAEIITFYDNILAGNPSVMFARVRSQGNKAFARKVMSVSSSAGGDSASQQQSSASAPGSSSASPCVSAFSESTAADDESPFVHEAHEFGSVKSIVFGVKPVFNADKSVIYFLTIQFVVTNEEDCVQEKYYVDDLLALLPDVFPEQDVDDMSHGEEIFEEDAAAEEAESNAIPSAPALGAMRSLSRGGSLSSLFALGISPKGTPEPEAEKPAKKKAPLRHVHGYGSYATPAEVAAKSPIVSSLKRQGSGGSNPRSPNHSGRNSARNSASNTLGSEDNTVVAGVAATASAAGHVIGSSKSSLGSSSVCVPALASGGSVTMGSVTGSGKADSNSGLDVNSSGSITTAADSNSGLDVNSSGSITTAVASTYDDGSRKIGLGDIPSMPPPTTTTAAGLVEKTMASEPTPTTITTGTIVDT